MEGKGENQRETQDGRASDRKKATNTVGARQYDALFFLSRSSSVLFPDRSEPDEPKFIPVPLVLHLEHQLILLEVSQYKKVRLSKTNLFDLLNHVLAGVELLPYEAAGHKTGCKICGLMTAFRPTSVL